jgi:hypothetical protein
MGIACVAHAAGVDPLNIPDTQLEPVEWAALDGWRADDHVAALCHASRKLQAISRL